MKRRDRRRERLSICNDWVRIAYARLRTALDFSPDQLDEREWQIFISDCRRFGIGIGMDLLEGRCCLLLPGHYADLLR